jgi:hypothetical protein
MRKTRFRASPRHGGAGSLNFFIIGAVNIPENYIFL